MELGKGWASNLFKGATSVLALLMSRSLILELQLKFMSQFKLI